MSFLFFLSFLLPHGASQKSPSLSSEPLETLYSMFSGERGASKDQVLRVEPKASRVTGLEKRDGHVLWLGLGERTGRLYLPPKQQPCPGHLELGQPGMKLCLLLNKGTGTETQESALWAPSRTWFDLERIGRVPDAQKYFLLQMPKIPPVTTPENLSEQLHLPVLMFPPSLLQNWVQNHSLHGLARGLIKVIAHKSTNICAFSFLPDCY